MDSFERKGYGLGRNRTSFAGIWNIRMKIVKLANIVSFIAKIMLSTWAGMMLLSAAITSANADPNYLGSAKCASCHVEQSKDWQNSHHDWALRPATDANVFGDFNDVTFSWGEEDARFFKQEGKFFAELDDATGKKQAFEIKYTVGVEPLQQYLVEIGNGRLQALDIAWDRKAKRWFQLYPDQANQPGQGLHWTGPYKNWQARCAVCHQTNFEKGFDPKTRVYQSQWSELNVGCESCHGPGADHVKWANIAEDVRPKNNTAILLSKIEGKLGQQAEINSCGECHARRSQLDGNSKPAGAKFVDHYSLSRLRDGLYHSDGQINDEVYVMGSFLQSKMYEKGVTCSNCHNPHSTKLLAKGNALCTQCHNPAGNEEFPSLAKKTYDSTDHHRHDPSGDGGQCVACHMPAKNYMIVDPRRDHSFRVPRPDLTVAIGAPNACSSCHSDKKAEWAANQIKNWYPEGRWQTPHYGQAIHNGRRRPGPETNKALRALATDVTIPAIVRATAIDLLGARLDQQILEILSAFLKDQSPLVRQAAISSMAGAPGDFRVQRLAPMLNDPVRTVRMAAVQATLDQRPTALKDVNPETLSALRQDFQNTIRANADFPETEMRAGGLALSMRNLGAADAAFNRALRMDPQLVDAWMVRARIAEAQNNAQGVAKLIDYGIRYNPDSAVLLQSRAGILMRRGDFPSAKKDLLRAIEADPTSVSLYMDIASVNLVLGENKNALDALKAARRLGEYNPQVLELMAYTYQQLGKSKEATRYAKELVTRFPRYQVRKEIRDILTGGN
jgi:predicted CXXCH cytochrome family protein